MGSEKTSGRVFNDAQIAEDALGAIAELEIALAQHQLPILVVIGVPPSGRAVFFTHNLKLGHNKERMKASVDQVLEKVSDERTLDSPDKWEGR